MIDRSEINSEIERLISDGYKQRDAFAMSVDKHGISFPFNTYSNYRAWRFKNGIKTVYKMKCQKCGEVVNREGTTQKYCRSCSNYYVRGYDQSAKSNWGNRIRSEEYEPDSLKDIREQRESEAHRIDVENKILSISMRYCECQYCNETFRSSKRTVYCSDLCLEMGTKIRQGRSLQSECQVCGKDIDYQKYVGIIKYCSNTCSELARRRRKYDNNQKDRCIAYGKRYEYIDRYYVYERDNYKCYICGVDVEETLEYSPIQATIDHVVPLSRVDDHGMMYGNHTLDNVRCCCHSCNSYKRDTDINDAGAAST